MSLWKQVMFLDPNSMVMESMILFYDFAMLIVMMILILICYMIFMMMLNKFVNRFMFEGQFIEIIWTIVPMFMLIFLAIPSLKVLYLTDEVNNPLLSLKVMGHQWYWSYEYNDFNNLNFDSFMLNESESGSKSFFRLLDVDNRFILPFNVQSRILISSSDVIHSFALPSMGVKVDAVPGRMNQVSLMLSRPGLFYGQCSEICGVNHSFMPIVVESTNLKNFFIWLNSLK